MNTDTNNRSRRKKWIIYGLIGVATVIICTVILINLIAEPYLKSRFQSEFASFSNQDASLEITELDIGLFPVSLEIDGTSLIPGADADDRMKDHPVLTSNIESISISNISWWEYFTSGNLTIHTVDITGADLHYTPGLSDRFNGTGDSSDQTRSTTVNSFSFNGLSLNIYGEDQSSVKTHVTGADLQILGLNLSSDIKIADTFDQFSFRIDSVSHHSGDGYYRTEATRLVFDSETGNFSSDGFMVIPQLSAHELPRHIGHEVDHIDLHSGPVQLNHLDVAAWLEDHLIKAGSITINEPEIRISRDKNPPGKPKEPRPLFNTRFANLPFSVSIDTLTIRNGYISYREWKEGQDSSGTVFFDSVEIQMTEIQNSSPDQTINASASTMFMNKSKLSVEFDFTLYDNGAQTITGQMDSLDLRHLNPVLTPLAFVRVDKGVIHSLSFNFELNETIARGEFMSLYEDFSMSFLSKEDLESTTGNRIVSFLANNIQIQSSNLEPDPRIGAILFEKEVGQSTVNYWWKSLRSGIKDLVQRM